MMDYLRSDRILNSDGWMMMEYLRSDLNSTCVVFVAYRTVARKVIVDVLNSAEA
jgi:hypothetical protein